MGDVLVLDTCVVCLQLTDKAVRGCCGVEVRHVGVMDLIKSILGS